MDIDVPTQTAANKISVLLPIISMCSPFKGIVPQFLDAVIVSNSEQLHYRGSAEVLVEVTRKKVEVSKIQ